MPAAEMPTVQLTYDTTFCLGDFYLSVLLYRETEFDPSPVIPLAFYVHERKLHGTHDAFFFSYINSVIPELDSSTNVFIVTDGEQAIITAVKNNLPNIAFFRCWNHTVQECKRWLRNHGVTTSLELSYYVDSVRELLQCASQQQYGQELLVYTTKWSQPFTQFFLDSIHAIIDHLGGWKQRLYG